MAVTRIIKEERLALTAFRSDGSHQVGWVYDGWDFGNEFDERISNSIAKAMHTSPSWAMAG